MFITVEYLEITLLIELSCVKYMAFLKAKDMVVLT